MENSRNYDDAVGIEGEVGLIGSLSTGREGVQRDLVGAGGESWCCAFAPDESRFAWSCGYRKVVLIPWNRYRNCLQSQDSTDCEGSHLSAERVSIDAGFIVCSLAFGTGTPEGEFLRKKRDHWTRFDFSNDLILATGHKNGRLRIWDPFTGRLLLELTDHKYAVNDVAFAPDGSLRLASGSEDGTIKVWDLTDDGNMFKTLCEPYKLAIRSIAWSPDSKYLCSTGVKQKVLLWNMETYSFEKRFCGHFNDIHCCSFSPDGAMLATASSDTRVLIWDVSSGDCIRALNHMSPPPSLIYMSGFNGASVRGVAFSHNGFQVATICCDGFVRFWDLTSASEEPEFVAPGIQGDMMLSCAFIPRGGALAVSHESGGVLFFASPNKVPTLLHCARMTLRKSLGRVSHRWDLVLPPVLKQYLDYKLW